MWWAALLNSFAAVLDSGGAGGGGGSYESIATATPSGVNGVTFTSISSSYKHLQLRFNVVTTAGGQSFRLRFNADTGDTNYASHALRGNGVTASASGYATGSGYSSIVIGQGNGSVTTYPNVGIIDVQDYASTTRNKTVRTFFGSEDNAFGGGVELDSGLWTSTSAINEINFRVAAGNFTGTVSLYGIKGA
jgi:hypothetical protein